MMIPAVVLLIIYNYIPMTGLVIAFQKFDITKGFFGSEWVGFANFLRVYNMPDSMTALYNTLKISFWKILTLGTVPIFISLLLNEVKSTVFKRVSQTLIYLPYFLSWVILAGIIKSILSSNGILNSMMGTKISFLGDNTLFPIMLVVTNLWKEFGFSTIVYLAAITGIDPTLYEAAKIDGANRILQTLHVTLPGMLPIIVLCSVLSLGGILNAGFEQIFNLYSVPVYETGDIIDTFVYRIGISSGQFDIATAVGLFKSVVSFVFVSGSYLIAYKYANYEIF